jgi:hypothetical protein
MSKSILSEFDAEISRFRQARALLTSAGPAIKRKLGAPANPASVVAPIVQKRKRGKLSAEARERTPPGTDQALGLREESGENQRLTEDRKIRIYLARTA